MFTIVRPKLFSGVRKIVSGGLSQTQVEAVETITAEIEIEEKYTKFLPLFISVGYQFSKLRPVYYGTRNKYQGRGYFPYFRGKSTYTEIADLLQIPEIISDPDLLLLEPIAAQVLVRSLTEGWINGKKVTDFDNFYAATQCISTRLKPAIRLKIAKNSVAIRSYVESKKYV